jgi:hypothetical protein
MAPSTSHSTAQHSAAGEDTEDRGGGRRGVQESADERGEEHRRGQRRGTCTVQYDVSLKVFRSSMSCSETYYSVSTDTITTLKSAKMSYPIFKDFDKSTAGTRKDNLFSSQIILVAFKNNFTH